MIFFAKRNSRNIYSTAVLSGALSKKHIDSGGDVKSTVETDCATLQRHYSCELFQKVQRYNGSTMLVRNELLLIVFDLSLSSNRYKFIRYFIIPHVKNFGYLFRRHKSQCTHTTCCLSNTYAAADPVLVYDDKQTGINEISTAQYYFLRNCSMQHL